jgi:hypothetical protein
MRAGPQLGVDAYGVSGFTRSCAPAIVYKAKQAENIMFSICEPKNWRCKRQPVARDSRFARYCEDNILADASILATIYHNP